ncbi:MAG TPA: PHP domain-containing protein [Candidatus Saccharimonadales bacterium]|nr:PHP domain-containing protein [Candidatus Saccharimonadales bacterium]
MACKIDFHTHSEASPDGALTERDYRRIFDRGLLDGAAVTDHNRIDNALKLQGVFGDKIIVGEEITTQAGEVIGLFLTEAIPAGLPLAEAVRAIKGQGGLVYVPHPFETVRKGLLLADLNAIAADVDIIEVYNGRAVFQDKSRQALDWAHEHHVPGAASSDSHGWSGWGRTYTTLSAAASRNTLCKLLWDAQYSHVWPGVRGLMYPKLNRLKKAGRRHG